MGNIVKQWIPAGIATLVFVLTLYGQTRGDMIEWAIIVASFAFLLGLLNVTRVHANKAIRQGENRIDSIALLLAGMATFALTFFSLLPGSPQAVRSASDSLFNHFISPIGASLAALMAVTLTLAAFRVLQVRRDWKAAVFVMVTVFVLLSSIPLANINWTPFSQLRGWIVDVVGMAGMRGLLLGVVLGTVVTAIRTLLWPRSES
jgi:hypothetical protein